MWVSVLVTVESSVLEQPDPEQVCSSPDSHLFTVLAHAFAFSQFLLISFSVLYALALDPLQKVLFHLRHWALVCAARFILEYILITLCVTSILAGQCVEDL